MVDLITGDLHLSENERDSYRFTFFEKTLPKLISKHKADRLLILGDLTERKDRHNAKLVNRIADGFDTLATFARKVIVLRGNHDYADERSPFFQFLSHIEGVSWINEPTTIGNDFYIPHTHDKERVLWDKSRTGMIFCHNTFEGAVSESGQRLKGIPINVFWEEARVISGDVHKPQTLGPVTYVGAPYRVRFGDDYDPRVLVRDGAKITSVPVDGPQKVLVKLTATTLNNWYAQLLDTPIGRGDIVKIEISLKSQEGWGDIKQRIREWAHEVGVVVHTIKPIVTEKMRPKKAVQNRKSDVDLVKEYGKNRKLSADVLKAGLTLMEVK